MSTSAARPLLSPEEIAVRAGQQTPFLHLPLAAEVFANRDIRLRQLAAGHSMRDYLLLMADLSRAQHDLLKAYPAVPLPDAEAVESAARAGMPLLPMDKWPRDPAWRDGLRTLLDALLARVPNEAARSQLQALRDADDEVLERQADRLLQGITFGLDLAHAPFIAAALQVYWTDMVLAVQAGHTKGEAPFGRTDEVTRCPCCGSMPLASLSRIDAGAGGLRYLQCALCSTQWHMVRVKCTTCQGAKGLHYLSLQAADAPDASASHKPAVEAECCDECGSYLKIMRMDRDLEVECAADDLATLSLDLLVSERQFERHGVNFMLLFGDPELPEPESGGG